LPRPSGAHVRGGAAPAAATDAALSDVAAGLANPEGHSLAAFEDSYRLYQRLHGGNGASCAGSSEAAAVVVDPNLEAYRDALQVLADAFRLYGPACVFGSYNGGKVSLLQRVASCNTDFARSFCLPPPPPPPGH
jgi:hypothetical protein